MRLAILADFPLHVLPEFSGSGEPGGHYATWLPQLAEGFAKLAGMELHWITLAPELLKPKEITWKNQKFHILPTKPGGRLTSLYRDDLASIRTKLQAIHPEFIHGWGMEDVYGLAAATSGYPHLVGVQGLFSNYVLRARMHPRDYLLASLELFTLNKAQNLVAESLFASDMCQRRRFFGPVHRVDYGVQRLFYETRWTPDPKKPIVVFCGAIDPRKGIQDLIAAFQDDCLRHAELWVLGGGAGRFADHIRRVAPSNVRFFGRLPIEASAAQLSRAWCFALPTRADTGPMAVKEARVIGLPVISTRCCGARDYVAHAQNGFHVRPGDIPALRSRLVTLLGDMDLCKSMGGCGLESQRTEFHPDTSVRLFMELYHNLLTKSRKRQ